MTRLERILRITAFIVWILYALAAIAICIMFMLMFGDLSGRFLFNSPIRGATEMSEYLLVAIAFLSLGYAQLKGIHISVNTIFRFFPKRLQTLLDIIFTLLALCFFIIMTMQISERAYYDWAGKILLSQTTFAIPIWWKGFVAAIGCAALDISLIIQLIRHTIKLVGRYDDYMESF